MNWEDNVSVESHNEDVIEQIRKSFTEKGVKVMIIYGCDKTNSNENRQLMVADNLSNEDVISHFSAIINVTAKKN